MRRRVRHQHRLKPAERISGGKGTNGGLQQRSATEGPWSRSGRGPRTHHGRNESGRGICAAVGAHGTVEQIVDRGQVLDGQTLSNRQYCPATVVQGHFRRRDVASALCGEEGAGSVTRRKKARTGASNGTGTRTSRLVGGHEVRSEDSAREKVLETSFFLRRRERTRDRRHGQ